MPTPLCAQHAGRLGVPLMIRLGFWAIILISLLMLGISVVMGSLWMAPWAIFGGMAAFVVLNMLVFLIEIFTPRMISYDYQTVKLAAVSPVFATAAGGPAAEPQSSGVNWAIIFLMAGSGLMMMMILPCGGVISGSMNPAVARVEPATDGGEDPITPPVTPSVRPAVPSTSDGSVSPSSSDGFASPATPETVEPTDLDEAIEWAKGVDTEKVTAGLDFIGRATVDTQRQAEVSQALAALLTNPSKEEPVLNALQTWGEDTIAPQIRTHLESKKLDSSATLQQKLAIKLLGKFADEESAGLIAEFLTSSSVSADAHAALAAIGKPAESAVLAYMNDDDTTARNFARNLLTRYATDDTTQARQCLTDLQATDSDVRDNAVEWLGTTQPVEEIREDVSKALNPLLTSTSSRKKAMAALKVWGTEHNVATIAAVMRAQSSFYHKEYVLLLGNIQHTSAVEAIIPELDNFSAKDTAFNVLTGYGSKIEPILIRHLVNPNRDIAEGVCNVLAVTGTPRSLKPLKAAYDLAKSQYRSSVYNAAERAYLAIKARGEVIDPATGKPVVNADDLREFTVDGEKKKLRFVSFTGGKPNFLTEDGTEVTYSMNELSRTDQTYIRNLLRNGQ